MTLHTFLCRRDFLPAHTVMVVPARRGLRSLYQVFAAHRAAMAAVNERPGFGRAFPSVYAVRSLYHRIFAGQGGSHFQSISSAVL